MADLREIALENIKGILSGKNDVFQAENTEDDSAFVMMLTQTALRKLVYIKSILKVYIVYILFYCNKNNKKVDYLTFPSV